MNYQLVLRSRTGATGTIIVGLLGLLFVVMIWSSEGPRSGIAGASIALALCYFTWWIWSWPAVIVERRGITVRNQVRTYRVGWDALKEAESNYGLYLVPNANSGSSVADSADPHPLTGGSDVPPKRIYCAGVPARGGFSTAHQKSAPTIPQLYFEAGPKVTLRVEPAVAARLIDEEKLLIDNPRRRDGTHQATPNQVKAWEERGPVKQLLYGKTPTAQLEAPAFEGITASPNIAVLAALVSLLAVAGILGSTL